MLLQVSGRYDQLAVFNFEKVTMYDEDTEESFTVSDESISHI